MVITTLYLYYWNSWYRVLWGCRHGFLHRLLLVGHKHRQHICECYNSVESRCPGHQQQHYQFLWVSHHRGRLQSVSNASLFLHSGSNRWAWSIALTVAYGYANGKKVQLKPGPKLLVWNDAKFFQFRNNWCEFAVKCFSHVIFPLLFHTSCNALTNMEVNSSWYLMCSVHVHVEL